MRGNFVVSLEDAIWKNIAEKKIKTVSYWLFSQNFIALKSAMNLSLTLTSGRNAENTNNIFHNTNPKNTH